MLSAGGRSPSQLKNNIAISSTDPDTFYTTGCNKGTGNGDTISLLPGAVFYLRIPGMGTRTILMGRRPRPSFLRK